MKNLIVFVFCLLFLSSNFAQNTSYATVDQSVNSWNETKITSVDKLSKRINEFDTDIKKTRAITAWMVKNLQYDYYSLNNNLITNARCAPDFVFGKKKGVCAGYANLFKELCDRSSIPCEVVSGIGRSPDQILKPEGLNHAWNVVEIDGEWQIVDVTWADNGQTIEEFYFCSNPDEIIVNHFPVDNKWQLISTPVELNRFMKAPYVYASFFSSTLKNFFPSEGLLAGDTISFQFESEEGTNYMIGLESLETETTVNNYTHFSHERNAGQDSVVVYLPKIGTYKVTFWSKLSNAHSYYPLISYYVKTDED